MQLVVKTVAELDDAGGDVLERDELDELAAELEDRVAGYLITRRWSFSIEATAVVEL